MTDSSGLGGRLRQARKSLDLTAAQMAEKVGLDVRQSWERYERGEASPKAEVLAKLADLNVDMVWLLTGVETAEARLEIIERRLNEETVFPIAAARLVEAPDLTAIIADLQGIAATGKSSRARARADLLLHIAFDDAGAGRRQERRFETLSASAIASNDPAFFGYISGEVDQAYKTAGLKLGPTALGEAAFMVFREVDAMGLVTAEEKRGAAKAVSLQFAREAASADRKTQSSKRSA